MRSGAAALAIAAGLALLTMPSARADEAERKAVAFLAEEVPRWAAENRCYSCHNNGDAARALYRARRAGLAIRDEALAGTTDWLARPGEWGGEGPGKDRRLARVQFSAALATATNTGSIRSPEALRTAAEGLVAEQAEDGSWPVEDGGAVGSPAAYGRTLATAMAVEALREAGGPRADRAIARGVAWLRSGGAEGTAVVDAAAVLLVEPTDPASRTGAGRRSIARLIATQGDSGGWGPHRGSPTEPFDTAIALVALARFRGEAEVGRAVERGRAALVAMQLGDGSWPATTRPAGGESYAQRISTAGWSLLGLLAARP